MATRVVTGSIYHAGSDYPWISASVQFVLAEYFSTCGHIYPGEKYVAVTGSGGDFAASLVVPACATANYQVILPSGEITEMNLASGVATSLDTLLAAQAAASSSQNALQTLIDAHAADSAVHHVRYTDAEAIAAIPAATTSTAGKVELATNAETQSGSDSSRAITPSGLASYFQQGVSASRMTISSSVNVSSSMIPLIVKGGGESSVWQNVQLLVLNTYEGGASPNYYENEAHIRLQAGSTQNWRRYINFGRYDGTGDDWLTGANAQNLFILYSASAGHVFSVNPTAPAYTVFSSPSGGRLYFNYHQSDIVGGCGISFHAGGIAAASNIALMAISTSAGGEGDTWINLDAGRDNSQNVFINMRDRGSSKYYIRKDASNNFSIYDNANVLSLLYWSTSRMMAIGHVTPLGTLHPKQTAASVASTTENVLVLGAATTATAACGFGTAVLFTAEDATVDNRGLGRVSYEWFSPTDASRSGRGKLTAYFTSTERTFLDWIAASGTVQGGFFGSSPIDKPSIDGSWASGSAGQSLASALARLGLITNNSTA